jgi:hypothetical protein
MSKNYEYFMESKMDAFVGEWVAICKEKVVSHGSDVKKVYAEAKRKCPAETPFLARLPEKDTMIF